MNLKQLITFTSLSLVTFTMSAQTKVIAHRGFWDTPGSAQNSITALAKADSIGCYGSEFDVWLTKDNVLIVNHDPTFKGKRMESSTAKEITDLRLVNNEQLPTLEEYLKKAQTLPNLHLVLELKSHKRHERETEAVKRIVEMVDKYGLASRTDYISFSLHATKEFIRLAPQSQVYYLNGELSPKELKSIGCAGLDYSIGTIKNNPNWIKEAHDLGLKVNVWTVNKESDMKWLIENNVDFITTNNPLLLQSILAN